MKFLENKEMPLEIIPVHCQVCHEDRTKKGAFIGEDKRAYCSDVTYCIERVYLSGETILPLGVDPANAEDLQIAIREGKLLSY